MRDERERTEGESRRLKILFWWLLAFVLLMPYPTFWAVRGYRYAREAARHGVSVRVKISLDGFGAGACASQDAIDGRIEFEREYYEKHSGSGYIRKEYGAEEGPSGFFFAIGATLGAAPGNW